ncbi:MAG: hypothetical protein C0432_05135 [Candidatus Puniceispirillum sp.]|nr:hypothetical protein [Candidatus Pelagibacter sp.]MBA4283659.1 hypothetical protein [Candidatus Puniceispirillum sp.]
MKKKIITFLFTFPCMAIILSKAFVSYSYCASLRQPPALVNPNSLASSAEIVNIDSFLDKKPDLSDKKNIFSNIIIAHNLWDDPSTKKTTHSSQEQRQNIELEPVVSKSDQDETNQSQRSTVPLWERNLIQSQEPDMSATTPKNSVSGQTSNGTSQKKATQHHDSESSIIRPKEGNEKQRIIEGGIVETTPIRYSSHRDSLYFIKISIEKNDYFKEDYETSGVPFIKYISQTNPATTNTTTSSNASIPSADSTQQPQGEVVITTSGKKFFIPFAPTTTNKESSSTSGTITNSTVDNQYVYNNSASLPQTTKDYAPRAFADQAKETGLNFPDTQLVNTNSPAYKTQTQPPQQSPLPEGIKIDKTAEKSGFALDEEQVLRMQSQIKFENLRIESTLLAMEKEELQRRLAEQLVKQLQAQKKTEKQKSIQINELRDLIKEVMSEAGEAGGGKAAKGATTSKFSMSNFNLKNKKDAKKAAKECSGKSQEECSIRSEMCVYKKFKIKGKKKSYCRIKCSAIPKKVCKAVKVCTTNKKGRCINKK